MQSLSLRVDKSGGGGTVKGRLKRVAQLFLYNNLSER